ncbi:MAG: hypothetical protein FWC78_01585 [Defluviitaleaceae bacterium]|nr:hypothetical protein [Defluviitaleaceae bacterium]
MPLPFRRSTFANQQAAQAGQPDTVAEHKPDEFKFFPLRGVAENRGVRQVEPLTPPGGQLPQQGNPMRGQQAHNPLAKHNSQINARLAGQAQPPKANVQLAGLPQVHPLTQAPQPKQPQNMRQSPMQAASRQTAQLLQTAAGQGGIGNGQPRPQSQQMQARPPQMAQPPMIPGGHVRPQQVTPQLPQPQPPMMPGSHAQQPQATKPPSRPPQAPITPEKAADTFRRFNKTLPDGVRYEPLDEETMRLLKANGHLPEAAAETKQPATQQASPPDTSQTQPAKSTSFNLPEVEAAEPPILGGIPPEAAKTLQNLAQDEFNAKKFYSCLAASIQAEGVKPGIEAMAAGSGNRWQQYVGLLEAHCDKAFTPAQQEIKTGLDFADSLDLALQEENAALKTLSELLDNVAETKLAAPVQRIINNKMVGYNQLFAVKVAMVGVGK